NRRVQVTQKSTFRGLKGGYPRGERSLVRTFVAEQPVVVFEVRQIRCGLSLHLLNAFSSDPIRMICSTLSKFVSVLEREPHFLDHRLYFPALGVSGHREKAAEESHTIRSRQTWIESGHHRIRNTGGPYHVIHNLVSNERIIGTCGQGLKRE